MRKILSNLLTESDFSVYNSNISEDIGKLKI